MKLKLIAIALLALGSAAALADQPADGPWLVHFRAVSISPENKSTDPTGGLGTNAIHVESKVIPEVDFSYFFTKNIAAELILTYPQKHTVKINGVDSGSFKELPPTLTLQYHFAPESNFQPYIGAGLNYTIISDVKLGGDKLNSDSWGGAAQIGFDYKIGQNSYINVDLKKVYIDTNVKVAGTTVSKVSVNPVLFGIGYGFRF